MTDDLKTDLHVLVIHPERIIFEGKAKAVTGKNDNGTFDILPLHSNFVSLIKEKVIIRTMDDLVQEIPIEQAILKVLRNQVYIFIGISEDLAPKITQ